MATNTTGNQMRRALLFTFHAHHTVDDAYLVNIEQAFRGPRLTVGSVRLALGAAFAKEDEVCVLLLHDKGVFSRKNIVKNAKQTKTPVTLSRITALLKSVDPAATLTSYKLFKCAEHEWDLFERCEIGCQGLRGRIFETEVFDAFYKWCETTYEDTVIDPSTVDFRVWGTNEQRRANVALKLKSYALTLIKTVLFERDTSDPQTIKHRWDRFDIQVRRWVIASQYNGATVPASELFPQELIDDYVKFHQKFQ
jgi:hypothetical protein